VMDPNLVLVKLLGKITQEREAVAMVLIKVFHGYDKLMFFLQSLVSEEIDSTSNPDIIFRGNSLATKSLDVYMKFIGMPCLKVTLQTLIKKMYFSKKSCEVDPSKLEKGEDPKKNLKNLLKWTDKISKAIFESIPNCPPEFRQIFHHIRSKVTQVYPQEKILITKYTAVTGFIFLRYFCPAILGPKLFHLMDEHPSINTNRALILVAKTLQNVANLVEFAGWKEEYMADMNNFVIDNMVKLKAFVDELASPPPAHYTPSKTQPIKLEKELASFHRYLKKEQQKMLEQMASQTEKEVMQRLGTILNNLENLEAIERIKLEQARIED